MAIFGKLFSKPKKVADSAETDAKEVEEEVIQLPKLAPKVISPTLEIQARKREEELCKHYGLIIPRHNEMLN